MRSDISVYHGVRHSKLQIYTFFACHAIAARHAMLQKKIFCRIFFKSGKMAKLQVQTEPQKPGPGSCVTGCTDIIESVYSTHRFLTIGNSRKILIGDKGEATVDARGYVIYVPDIIRCEGSGVMYCCIYKRGLLQVLPSDSNRQCEKLPTDGRATSTDSHAFLYSHESGEIYSARIALL